MIVLGMTIVSHSALLNVCHHEPAAARDPLSVFSIGKQIPRAQKQGARNDNC
jgi:hypothetical protein